MNWLPSWLRRNAASHWFARIRSGEIGEHDDKVFIDWLETSPANTRSYDDQELAWSLALELEEHPQIARLVEETRSAAARRPGNRLLPFARPRLIAAASTLLLAFAGGALFLMNRTWTAEYVTNAGEQRIVPLEDGSTVTLNTVTQVRVRFSRKGRSVELMKGEALFSVHPDVSRPFSVLAQGGVTTAVGTEFAVDAHGAAAEVSVLEGTVTVRSLGSSPDLAGTRVGAGQAVDYQASGILGEIHSANTERIRAWQANRILFSDKPLSDAIEEYNRYTAKRIVLAAPELKDRRVHGIFRIGDEDAFVHALERALPLRAKYDEQAITLVPR
jgi:transmembrane sensor